VIQEEFFQIITFITKLLETREGLMNKKSFEPQKLTLNRLPLLVFVSILLLGLFACDKATGIQDTSGAETVEDLDQERQQNEEHVSTINGSSDLSAASNWPNPGVYTDGSNEPEFSGDLAYSQHAVWAADLSYHFFDIAHSSYSDDACYVTHAVMFFEPHGTDSFILTQIGFGQIDNTYYDCDITDQDIRNMSMDYTPVSELMQENDEVSESDLITQISNLTDESFSVTMMGDVTNFYRLNSYPSFLDYLLE